MSNGQQTLSTQPAASSGATERTSAGHAERDEITAVLTNLEAVISHHREGGLNTAEARARIQDIIRADANRRGIPATAHSIAEHTNHWQLQLEANRQDISQAAASETGNISAQQSHTISSTETP
jgi:hypothetical protein